MHFVQEQAFRVFQFPGQEAAETASPVASRKSRCPATDAKEGLRALFKCRAPHSGVLGDFLDRTPRVVYSGFARCG